MWTAESRALVGDFGAGQALSDEQYALLAPMIPPAKPGGRPRSTDMRRMLDGCSTWCAPAASGATYRRPRPSRPGGRSTATCAASRARACGRRSATTSCSCCANGRQGAEPDRRDRGHPERQDDGKGGPRGYDAAKKVGAGSGTSRSTPRAAARRDRPRRRRPGRGRGRRSPRRLKRLYPWLEAVFADGAYDRLAALLACFLLGLTLIIVRRLAGSTGFVLLPRRWVAERTLAGSAGGAASPGSTRSCPRSPRPWSSWP